MKVSKTFGQSYFVQKLQTQCKKHMEISLSLTTSALRTQMDFIATATISLIYTQSFYTTNILRVKSILHAP